MIKRIIVMVAWGLLTIFYAWNFADFGRSTGTNTTSAIEFHLESYNDSLASILAGEEQYKRDIDHAFDGYIYSRFHDLSKEYKENFMYIVVFTIIYIIATLICYDVVFIKPRFAKLLTSSQSIPPTTQSPVPPQE